MSILPQIPPPRRADHVRFELSGGHTRALGVLRDHLGTLRALRAVAALVRRQATRDPFADLPPVAAEDVAEWLCRRQLGPVLHLADVLTQDLGLERAQARRVLAEVIAEVGALLLSRRFPRLDPIAWARASPQARETVARAVFARLGNIFAADVDSTARTLSFDVRRCRFVELCAQVGQPDLAPLFCAADERFFQGAGAPVSLERTRTLATGAACCDFRFSLHAPEEAP